MARQIPEWLDTNWWIVERMSRFPDARLKGSFTVFFNRGGVPSRSESQGVEDAPPPPAMRPGRRVAFCSSCGSSDLEEQDYGNRLVCGSCGYTGPARSFSDRPIAVATDGEAGG